MQCARKHHSLLKTYESIHELEHRTGRIGSLHGPVEHRLVWIFGNFGIVGAYVREHFHINSGAGNHREYFSGGRLDCHQGPHLVCHKHLPIVLEFGINGGRDIIARHGFLVHFPVSETGLNAVAGIAQIDIVALFSSEFLFHSRFYTCLARIVSASVFVRMFLYEIRIHFGDIAQQVSSRIVGIFPHTSRLSPESRELVGDFREFHISLRRQLFEEGQSLPTYAAAESAVLGHLFPYEFGLYGQGSAEFESVESFHFLGRYEQVIDHLVAHEDIAVAVVYDSSGGVDGGIDHRIVGRVDFVFVVYNLDDEEPGYQCDSHSSQTEEQLCLAVQYHNCSLLLRLENTFARAIPASRLTA